MSSGHRYEAVGDGNIGVEAEVVAAPYDAGSGNDDGVGYETSIPVHPKILAPLCYLIPLASGLLIVLFERRNTYVRLHAWQAIILSLFASVASMLLFWLPLVPSAIHLASLVVLCLCIFRAWKDADTLTFFKLGFIGDAAERQVLGTAVLPL
ncbi:hypothetical protein H4R18_004997 [Coemansia javaensis]|uniref:Uncharacterized protein n=1 Tax=Coemansia javaensis TaxID=2761396 RepID=A0A9W8H6B2_9FUNG|nr:hypothetical protein H4R18_004997 [Coemansia javaensis]